MTTNSQLLTTKPKKKKPKKPRTKQITRTGTDSQKQRSHGRLSAGKWRWGEWKKRYRIRSINGRYKIERGKLRIV